MWSLLLSLRCLSCGSYLQQQNELNLCLSCHVSLDLSAWQNSTHIILKERLKQQHLFEDSYSLYPYTKTSIAHDLIHELKYKNNSTLAYELGMLLAAKLQNLNWDIDYILAVPIHPTRQLKRGFNQSEKLAKSVAKNLDIPILNALIRHRNTKTQTKLDKDQRLQNLADCFSLKYPQAKMTKSKNLLLVDDVITTGTTVTELARILIPQKPAKLFVCSIGLSIN